jgi:hypothetical protein
VELLWGLVAITVKFCGVSFASLYLESVVYCIFLAIFSFFKKNCELTLFMSIYLLEILGEEGFETFAI